MPIHSVFYVWQSDLPSKTNRGFIHKALKRAIALLDGEDNIQCKLDMDTQALPGAPNISAAILDAIDRASVVVCDVTPIGVVRRRQGKTRKQIPNPNVMFEAGYALARHAEGRLILIRNLAHFADHEKVFDLYGNRELAYLRNDPTRDADTKPAELAADLRNAISRIVRLEAPLPGSAENRIDLLDLLPKWHPSLYEEGPERMRIGLTLQEVATKGGEPRFYALSKLLTIAQPDVPAGWHEDWHYGPNRFENVRRDLLQYWQPASSSAERDTALSALERFAVGMDLYRRRMEFARRTPPPWLAVPNAANPEPFFEATATHAADYLADIAVLGVPTDGAAQALDRFKCDPTTPNWRAAIKELLAAENQLDEQDPCWPTTALT